MPNIERFCNYIEEIAMSDTKYGDGTPMTEETNQTALEFELCVKLDLFSPDDPSRPIPPIGTTIGIGFEPLDIPEDVALLLKKHFGEKFSLAIVPLSALSPFNHAGLLWVKCNRKGKNDGT